MLKEQLSPTWQQKCLLLRYNVKMVFLVSKRHPITFTNFLKILKCLSTLSRLITLNDADHLGVSQENLLCHLAHPIDQLRIYESHKKPFMYCHMCVSKVDCATAITPNPQTDAFFNRVVTQRLLPRANLWSPFRSFSTLWKTTKRKMVS